MLKSLSEIKNFVPEIFDPVKHAYPNSAKRSIIIGGPGAGKSYTLLQAFLKPCIADPDVNWEDILSCSFTKAAAKNLRDRLKIEFPNLDDWKLKNICSTIHSEALKRFRIQFEGQQFTIIGEAKAKTDEDDGTEGASRFLVDLPPNMDIKEKLAVQIWDLARNKLITDITSKAFAELVQSVSYKADIGQVRGWITAYENDKRKNKRLDLTDILIAALRCPSPKRKILLIDEMQDLSPLQHKIIKKWGEESEYNVLFGDCDQCFTPETLIKTKEGIKQISEIKENTEIEVPYGLGKVGFKKVEKVHEKEYKGKIVKLTLEDGSIIRATPEHKVFVNKPEESWYVYLMYKKNYGFRVGITSNKNKSKRKGSYQIQRLVGEHADKLWILHSFNSKVEAIYFEHLISIKYGFPTWVFVDRLAKEGINSYSQVEIDRLFKDVDTFENFSKIEKDYNLSFDYPHCKSGATTHHTNINNNRLVVHLRMFSGERKNKRKNRFINNEFHYLSLQTSDEKTVKYLKEKSDIKTRISIKKDTGLISCISRKESTDFKVLYEKAKELEQIGFDIHETAQLLEEGAGQIVTNIGSLDKNWFLVTNTKGKLNKTKIIKKEIEEYQGKVYDLSVRDVSSYFANNICVHNCIFSFTGCDNKHIFKLIEEGFEVRRLFKSFRVPKVVHTVARKLILRNKERFDSPYEPKDGSEGYIRYATKQNALLDLEETIFDEDKDCFILARSTGEIYNWSNLLDGRGIPYINERGYSPWGSAVAIAITRAIIAIKEDIPLLAEDAYRLVAEFPGRDLAFFNKGVKKGETVEILKAWKRSDVSIQELEKLGLNLKKVREDTLAQLLTDFKQEERSEHIPIALARCGNEVLYKTPKIRLTSSHSSKGREADLVIVDLAMPWKVQHEIRKDESIIEEERRLIYVAMTRTKDSLILVRGDKQPDLGKIVGLPDDISVKVTQTI